MHELIKARDKEGGERGERNKEKKTYALLKGTRR